MNNSITIHADSEKSCFVLTGNIVDVLKNRRFIFSLKRLNFFKEDKKILIPYEEKTQIRILKELQEFLVKFNFSEQFTEETKKDVASFHREQKTFKEFSEQARKIRDNEINKDSKLFKNLIEFEEVLKKRLSRQLYKNKEDDNPYQLLAAYHMAFSQNSCNFAVPGAGKTSIVYGAYAYLKNLSENDLRHVDKILVIGPISSFAPWENEYEKCFGKKVNVQRLSGDSTISRDQKEQHLYSGSPVELTLVWHGSVEGLQQEIVDFLKKNKTMVVVDEAHRIKNHEGRWGKSAVEIAKEAKSRVVLTGTPVPNGYEDLYNLYQFIYPYKFKDILRFHHGNLVDMTKTCDFDDERVKQFTKNISPYFIRIKKKDLNLPLVKNKIIFVDMDEYQREIYDFIETKYISSFQQNSFATVKDVLNKAKLIRLRQTATNPALLKKPIQETLSKDDYDSRIALSDQIPEEFQDDSEILSKIYDYAENATPQKFKTVKEIVEKIITEKGKVIIWTIFIQNAKGLQQYLFDNDIKSKLLIGEVEQTEREIIIKKFNNPENQDFQVVIANPFSVAESISLHKGCHNAIYMERDYNCSNFLQSKDRIHRVGLLKNQETNYYYILSKDSVDEDIHKLLNIKVERMEKIIDEDIPLFARINDKGTDETDIIKSLLESYAKRT
ncbi:MAG: DEAD/DEAH box helicase [Candidatus Pacebacteria bacterium]|nr:DEAD/DEAH box helicase [Candidatus Paceibacterota bacterium]